MVNALYEETIDSVQTPEEKSFLSSHYAGFIARV